MSVFYRTNPSLRHIRRPPPGEQMYRFVSKIRKAAKLYKRDNEIMVMLHCNVPL